MKNKTYEIFYNEEADFLEVFFDEPTKCYVEEIEPGIFIRKDEKTNEIKSIEILGFKKRALILEKILEKVSIKLPINVSA